MDFLLCRLALITFNMSAVVVYRNPSAEVKPEAGAHHPTFHRALNGNLWSIILDKQSSIKYSDARGDYMNKRLGVTVLENQIRHRRQAMRLSQQALATRCGLTRQAINAMEAGHYSPSTTVALGLAKVLGCTVEELF